MNQARTYSTFVSSLISVASNWSNRLISLVSIVVLARLLTPTDFGVIAMATLMVGLTDVLLNLGVHVPLIQNQNATQSHYDSAWTLRIMQTGVTTACLVVAAPLAADYFNDARVEPVVQILAFKLLLGGLENIGVIDFQKRMQFGAEFRLRFYKRMTGFLVTMTMAVLLRSYWAMVIGMMSQAVAGVGLSYLMHSMRPKLSLSKVKEIFGVSQWMLVLGLGQYLRGKLHRILVGRWEGADVLGSYTLAHEISIMPTTELLSPVNRALFARFAQEQDSDERLKQLLLLAQGVQSLIAIPAAIGLAVVAEPLVLFALGSDWLSAVPFIQILALMGVIQALTTSGMYVILSRGKTRLKAAFSWAQVIAFSAVAATPLMDRSAMGVAQLLFIVTMASFALQVYLVKRTLPCLRAVELLGASWRPLAASAVMAAVLVRLPLEALQPLWALALQIVVGGAAYAVSAIILWGVSGRPEGAESYMQTKLMGLLNRS